MIEDGEAIQAAAVGIMRNSRKELGQATSAADCGPCSPTEDWLGLGRKETGHYKLQIWMVLVAKDGEESKAAIQRKAGRRPGVVNQASALAMSRSARAEVPMGAIRVGEEHEGQVGSVGM